MSDLFRETAFGQLVRSLTHRRVFFYPEERPSFVAPTFSNPKTDKETPADTRPDASDPEALARAQFSASSNSSVTLPPENPSTIIVTWYSDADPDNPQNWSPWKKALTTAIICLLTFSVYVGSSLITSGFPSLMEDFGISEEKANTTLSVYVFFYGLGALLFAPLSEIPQFGRNPWYIWPMILFTALQVGAATTPTFTGLVLIRCLTAFLGSNVLSSGGATLADMYSPALLPIVFATWLFPAFSAPAIGPVFGNYAAIAHGWRWTMWELLWCVGFCTICMFFFLPETYAPNILLRRAKRLRALTGNNAYKSASEISQSDKTPKKIFFEAIIRPMEIMFLDPSIFFANMYTSLVYSIYYTFFSAFPIVYLDVYHFSWGSEGLSYLAMFVGTVVGYILFVLYQRLYMFPFYARFGWPINEKRLEPALLTSITAPIGLFMFAWASRHAVHWIVPMIGSGLFVTSFYTTFQCILFYVILSYPQYAASLLAANDFCRSAFAAGFVHAAKPMYEAMTIAGGVSFLAGLLILGIAGMWGLWRFGARLRAKSRFAVGDQ